MQARDIPDSLPEKIEEHTTRFEDMTLADCEFWMQHLASYEAMTYMYKPPLPWRPVRERRRADREAE